MRTADVLFAAMLVAVVVVGLVLYVALVGDGGLHYEFTHGPGCPEPIYEH